MAYAVTDYDRVLSHLRDLEHRVRVSDARSFQAQAAVLEILALLHPLVLALRKPSGGE